MKPRMELYNSHVAGQTDRSPEPRASSSRPPKSQPPPLPESARRLSPVRAAADAVFADCMIERLAASDYAGVAMAAEALLEHQPNHEDALDCVQIARSELAKVYLARLGSMGRVPRVAMGSEGLVALSLGFGEGFLLSRVDGRATIRDIVEACGLPKLEAMRILSELFLRRAIGFDD
jgi:hypothetical protein